MGIVDVNATGRGEADAHSQASGGGVVQVGLTKTVVGYDLNEHVEGSPLRLRRASGIGGIPDAWVITGWGTPLGAEGGGPHAYVLEELSCPEDLDHSGAVDFGDILVILAAWGSCEGECPEDLDGSGAVDFGDVLVVLAAWGPCE